MMQGARRPLAYWHLIVPLLAAPLMWWVFETTNLDRWLIGFYYDAAAHAFPLRDDVIMEGVMHSGLKMVVIAIGLALFGAWLLSFLVPQLPPYRRRLLWLFIAMTGATLLVSLLKQYSALHCPWDLAEYGGYAPFHTLFERLPDNAAPGHCFPGGHASGGFALFAFYFGLRDTHARQARLWLAAAVVLGMMMGWSQMMRGAHFLSHTVWSAWVEWMFLALLYQVVPPDVFHAEPLPGAGV